MKFTRILDARNSMSVSTSSWELWHLRVWSVLVRDDRWHELLVAEAWPQEPTKLKGHPVCKCGQALKRNVSTNKLVKPPPPPHTPQVTKQSLHPQVPRKLFVTSSWPLALIGFKYSHFLRVLLLGCRCQAHRNPSERTSRHRREPSTSVLGWLCFKKKQTNKT